MSDSSVLEKLESGSIDFETAYASIQSKLSQAASQAHSGSSGLGSGASITRNLSGQVVLAQTSEFFAETYPPTPVSRVQLLDINLIHIEDTMPKSPGPADVIPMIAPDAPTTLVKALTKISSPEDVVKLSFPQHEVALITLMDETNRNMFSPELAEGVNGVFKQIAELEHLKAVVVTGYGNWFCSGGTPESLEAIRQGGMSFLDDTFFKSLLDCPLPTVAAIQGHALGGGLTFGLYADLIVLAENGYYAANFMEHGFTPGVGATLVFPRKFGPVLGNEMMLTARRYQGRELRERGAPMEIVGKDLVLTRALELAASLAQKPVLQLKQLKAHLAQAIVKDLPDYFAREQAMHDTVFAEHRTDDDGVES